jgi:hypothetical protein
MKVKELIAELKKLNQDMEVTIETNDELPYQILQSIIVKNDVYDDLDNDDDEINVVVLRHAEFESPSDYTYNDDDWCHDPDMGSRG